MRFIVVPVLAILLLISGGCAVPPRVTSKPNVTPVATSNKHIQESSRKIKQSNQQALKLNQNIQGLLDSADQELAKLLK